MSRPRKKVKAAPVKAAPAKAPKAGPRVRRERRSLRPFFAAVGTLTVAAAALLGLSHLGQEARLRVGERARYEAKFADIECPSPPAVERSRFLVEVRTAAGLAETFQLLDSELHLKLRAAFAAHPWVASVDAVAVEPPARVRLGLSFRTPALVVRLAGLPGGKRVVDANGVLLPPSAVPADLPELVNRVASPTMPDGSVWADPLIGRAVELVRAYRPGSLEKTAAGWQLKRSNWPKPLKVN